MVYYLKMFRLDRYHLCRCRQGLALAHRKQKVGQCKTGNEVKMLGISLKPYILTVNLTYNVCSIPRTIRLASSTGAAPSILKTFITTVYSSRQVLCVWYVVYCVITLDLDV
jgi:hypothetical protein